MCDVFEAEGKPNLVVVALLSSAWPEGQRAVPGTNVGRWPCKGSDSRCWQNGFNRPVL